MTTENLPKVPVFDEAPTDRTLAIICSKGNLDMAYPGLVLANAALSEGIEVHLFFTFWGFDIIAKDRQHKLGFTPAGNTAMHVPWGGRIPQWLAALPGMQIMATWMLRKQVADLGIPPIPAFLDQITASGGQLWACKMSADMQGLAIEDLRDDVSGIINAVDFMELSDGAQTLFI